MKRAVWRGTVREFDDGGRPERDGSWHCYHDDQGLVVEGDYHVRVQLDLVRLPLLTEGLPTFGLPDRTRRSGRSTRGGANAPGGQRRRRGQFTEEPELPIYVYCPRPGCGRGQRVG